MLNKIRDILERQLNLDPEEVTENSLFNDDLCMEPLDLFELVLCLEAESGFEIPADDLKTFNTVGDMIGYLRRHDIGV